MNRRSFFSSVVFGIPLLSKIYKTKVSLPTACDLSFTAVEWAIIIGETENKLGKPRILRVSPYNQFIAKELLQSDLTPYTKVELATKNPLHGVMDIEVNRNQKRFYWEIEFENGIVYSDAPG